MEMNGRWVGCNRAHMQTHTPDPTPYLVRLFSAQDSFIFVSTVVHRKFAANEEIHLKFTRFGFDVRLMSLPIRTSTARSFHNISTEK